MTRMVTGVAVALSVAMSLDAAAAEPRGVFEFFQSFCSSDRHCELLATSKVLRDDKNGFVEVTSQTELGEDVSTFVMWVTADKAKLFGYSKKIAGPDDDGYSVSFWSHTQGRWTEERNVAPAITLKDFWSELRPLPEKQYHRLNLEYVLPRRGTTIIVRGHGYDGDLGPLEGEAPLDGLVYQDVVASRKYKSLELVWNAKTGRFTVGSRIADEQPDLRDFANRLSTSKITWTTGGVAFTLESDDLRAARGSRTVFSAQDNLERLLVEMTEGSGRTDLRYAIFPASIVGTWLSYETVITDGKSRTISRNLSAVNLAKDAETSPRQGTLLDLFTEREITEALTHCAAISQYLKHPAKYPSLAELEKAVNARKHCDFRFSRAQVVASFAFHHLEDRRGLVVRLLLPEGCDGMTGKFAQCSLHLPVPAPLAGALEKADAREQGILMKDAERVDALRYHKGL